MCLKGERPVLSPFFIFYRIIRREDAKTRRREERKESLMADVGSTLVERFLFQGLSEANKKRATKVAPTVPPLYSGSWRQKHKLKNGKNQCLIYNRY
jgi:hypothetical protein